MLAFNAHAHLITNFHIQIDWLTIWFFFSYVSRDAKRVQFGIFEIQWLRYVARAIHLIHFYGDHGAHMDLYYRCRFAYFPNGRKKHWQQLTKYTIYYIHTVNFPLTVQRMRTNIPNSDSHRIETPIQSTLFGLSWFYYIFIFLWFLFH